jgi:hypothetical protein
MISNTRLRADLDWCVQSPALIASHPGNVTWPTDQWFAKQVVSSSDVDLPQPRHHHHFRLGQHFEKLLIHWMKSADDLDLLFSNVQVFDHKRTVGEFDFLVNHDGQLEHWEVAIKFFLGLGNGLALNHWHGPNTADRFDTKFKHLVDHQLRLSGNPLGLEKIRSLGLGEIDKPAVRCVVKGRLFYPWEQFVEDQFLHPEVVNPTHGKGWWVEEDKITDDQVFDSVVYLAKQDWLSIITPQHKLPVMNRQMLVEFLQGQEIEQATHVALLDGTGLEVSRGFIVKPIWVERARLNTGVG